MGTGRSGVAGAGARQGNTVRAVGTRKGVGWVRDGVTASCMASAGAARSCPSLCCSSRGTMLCQPSSQPSC